MNRVVIVGRMTRDPELKTVGDNSVCRFTLALERNFKSADGQQADFIPVVVWNKMGENVAHYCGKGSLVGVDGTLRSRSYENKNGQRVFIVEVKADNVQFLDTRAARERRQANAQNRASNDFYNNAGNNQQVSARASNDNFYNGNQQNGYAGNNHSQQNNFNNAATANNQHTKPQNQNQNDFYDMKTVDNSYNIMDDDIQF